LDDSTRRLDELEHGELGIRASLSLSYAALSTSERRLLRRLALLDTPDLAAWVGAAVLDVDVDEAEEMCDRLVEAQLLTASRCEPASPVRYRHPELVRVFARERALAEESPAQLADATRRAFAALLYLAAEAHRREYGGDFTILHGTARTWPLPKSFVDGLLHDPVAWLDSERTVLIAAIGQTAGLGWDEACWDLALTGVTLFEARGYFSDWNDTAQTALRACRAQNNARGEAAMLHSLGALRLFERRLDEAGALCDQALQAFEQCGDPVGTALVLRNLAHLDRMSGRVQRARDRYETALAGLTAAGDIIGRAHVLSNVAGLCLDAGDRERARDLLTEALGLCRTVGGRRVEAQILHRLGEVCLDDGDIGHAAEMFTRVLRIVRHAGDRTGEAYALLGLGVVRHRDGHHDQATTCLSDALALARRTGERFVEARALHALGGLDLSRDRAELAAERFTEAARLFGEIPAVAWQKRSHAALADALARCSDARERVG
jgi:tetratricopeptide (TPR) repeat protein